MNEGVFPSYQAITADDSNEEIEEERRLCYVGITRAKKNLYLSAARRRMHNGNYNTYLVSRFIDEIDNNNIVKNLLPSFGASLGNDFETGLRSGRPNYSKNSFKNSFSNNNFKFSEYYNNIGVSKVDLKKSIDTYKTGSNIVKATSLDYKVGDRVSHIKFGDGKVTNIEDVGRDYEVTVEFDDAGEKTLFAAFAKLEKI